MLSVNSHVNAVCERMCACNSQRYEPRSSIFTKKITEFVAHRWCPATLLLWNCLVLRWCVPGEVRMQTCMFAMYFCLTYVFRYVNPIGDKTEEIIRKWNSQIIQAIFYLPNISIGWHHAYLTVCNSFTCQLRHFFPVWHIWSRIHMIMGIHN